MGIPTKSNICGNRMGLPTDTVCSKLSKKAFSKKKTLSNTRAFSPFNQATLVPFSLNFRSDEFEVLEEAKVG